MRLLSVFLLCIIITSSSALISEFFRALKDGSVEKSLKDISNVFIKGLQVKADALTKLGNAIKGINEVPNGVTEVEPESTTRLEDEELCPILDVEVKLYLLKLLFDTCYFRFQ